MLPKLTITGLAVSSLFLTASGCAALYKTRPQDMTVPEHRDAARQDEAAAQRAESRAVAGGRTAAQNRATAASLRSRSAEHAAAADARLHQTNEACQGADARDALESLRVFKVEPISEADVPNKVRYARGYYPESLKGARIIGRPSVEPAGPLAAALRCEAALASAGIEDDDAQNPLTVKSAATTIRQQGSTVIVEVRSKDSRAASEILRRARLLASAGR